MAGAQKLHYFRREEEIEGNISTFKFAVSNSAPWNERRRYIIAGSGKSYLAGAPQLFMKLQVVLLNTGAIVNGSNVARSL